LAKGLSASRKPAHEWLDFIMDTLVGLEVAELGKCLVAVGVWTLIWTFASVLALMSLIPKADSKQSERRHGCACFFI
jgi:hypothetical protein